MGDKELLVFLPSLFLYALGAFWQFSKVSRAVEQNCNLLNEKIADLKALHYREVIQSSLTRAIDNPDVGRSLFRRFINNIDNLRRLESIVTARKERYNRTKFIYSVSLIPFILYGLLSFFKYKNYFKLEILLGFFLYFLILFILAESFSLRVQNTLDEPLLRGNVDD